MIISHKYRFVFVRCRKTASTSLEIALSRFLGPKDVVTPISLRDEKIRAELGYPGPQNYLGMRRSAVPEPRLAIPDNYRYYHHMPADAIQTEMGIPAWLSYFTFCFERDPFEKVISLYYHRYRTEPRPTIDSFLLSREFEQAHNFPLYAPLGEVIVNHVARFEHLDQELAFLCERIGLPEPMTLPRAKTQFRQDNRPGSEILTPWQRHIIEAAYADELNFKEAWLTSKNKKSTNQVI
jgi:hypothetical protein